MSDNGQGVVLKASGVQVRYGAVVAVHSVDLAAKAGAIHGVIGPNGAGKSSFIDALSGRTRLFGGRVELDGDDITSRSPVWRRKHGISRSFQRTSIFPAMSVGSQLELVAKTTSEEELGTITDALGLRSSLAAECGKISYGDQRAVDVALALIGNPRAVLLDEPGAGLSAYDSQKLLEHLRGVCIDRGVATVLVEHDVESVFRVCDEVTVLHLGRVLVSGVPGEVRKDQAVIDAYLGSMA